MGVCDRSSSEETLNNVGEPQEGQPPSTGPVNGGFSYKSVGTGRVTPHNLGGGLPVPATAQPFVPATHPLTVINSTPAASVSASVAHTAPVSTSCSSRFRVIKLDHGTGEPFRRGRWTCTEFYERDSDSSVNRTVDSIKPTVTLDHSIERDSGLGAMNNSVVTSSSFAQALENPTDSGYSLGHPTHPHPSDPPQHGYSLSPQLGSGASAFQATGFTTTASQQPQQAQVNIQPVAPQPFHSNSLNGLHQGATHKSPIMSPATQTQHLTYSTHPTGLSASQPDYRKQHFGSSTQNPPISALPVGPPTSQAPMPQITSAGPGAQGLGGEAGSAQGHLHQVSSAPAKALILPGSEQQLHTSQAQPSGGKGIALAPSITTSTSHSGVQNAPATVPSNTNTPPSGGHIQLQGTHGGTTTGLPSGFSNQTEDTRLKSDCLPQLSACVMPGRDGVKPFIGEGFNLPTPAVSSLFGIHIAMNVEEDR